MRLSLVFGRVCLGVAILTVAVSAPARAADRIALGKAYPSAFPFSLADIGKQAGIFEQHDLDVSRKSYEAMLPMMLRDGHFDREALKIVAAATVELQLLEREPDMTLLYTEAFLPKTN